MCFCHFAVWFFSTPKRAKTFCTFNMIFYKLHCLETWSEIFFVPVWVAPSAQTALPVTGGLRSHWFVFFTAALVEIKSITRHPMDKWCVARSVMPLSCSVSWEQLYSIMMTDGDQWLLHSKWICFFFFFSHTASLFTFSSSSFIQGGFITLCILWKRGIDCD